MPNPTQLIRAAEPIEERTVVGGYVATTRTAPTTFAEGAWVVLPEFSTTALVGPCQWGAIHGKAKPKQGARVEVAIDDMNEPRIVWWEGEYKEPGGGGKEYLAKAGGGLELAGVETNEFAIKAEGVTEGDLAAALLGPAANKFGLRKLGTGALEALPGNTAFVSPTELATELTGYLALGGSEQTVTVKKKFNLFEVLGVQPASVGGATGTEAPEAFKLTAAKGGETTIATTGTGGKGEKLLIASGVGGEANSAATKSTGGAGGALTVEAATGGEATTLGKERVGGAGGATSVKGGKGGKGSGGETHNTGGAGGALTLAGGEGGEGEALKIGSGGNATLKGGNIGNSSGALEPGAHTAGSALIEGGSGFNNASHGKVLLRTNGTTRLEINGAGETKIGVGNIKTIIEGQLEIETAEKTLFKGPIESTGESGTLGPAILTGDTGSLAESPADAYVAGFRSSPKYKNAGTVTRHNYWDVKNVELETAEVTNACVMRFNANAGTHKAVDGETKKEHPSEVKAWVKINVNGTLMYMPAYESKTS